MALLFIHPEVVVRTVATKPPSTLVMQTTYLTILLATKSYHTLIVRGLAFASQYISTQSWVESIAIKSDVTY